MADLNQIRHEASGQCGLVRLCSPSGSAPFKEAGGQIIPKSPKSSFFIHQTISLLVYLNAVEQVDAPHLVLCPLSVLENWRNELRRYSMCVCIIKWDTFRGYNFPQLSNLLFETEFAQTKMLQTWYSQTPILRTSRELQKKSPQKGSEEVGYINNTDIYPASESS